MINPSPKYSGEPSAQALAGGLATLGRYGDNYMVHAAEGETVVPREILEANPGLREDLFRQMTMMGIEDPNRYVVGNELNSINPITGQPEFFFKKIFRAVKKVIKKIAPIAAPIIGNMIAPGIGGIVASGLVTKLQGGSWGDALKSAALSYGASALTSGIGSALQGTSVGDFIGAGTPTAGSTFAGRFAEGLGTGLTAPFSAASNLFSSGAQNPLAQGIFGPRGTGAIFSSLGGTKANPSAFAQSGQKGIMGRILPSYQTGSQLTQPLGPTSSQIDREIASNLTNMGKGQSFNPEAYRIARNRGFDEVASFSMQSEPGAAQQLISSGSTSAAGGVPAAAETAAAKTAAAETAAASSDPGFLQRNLGATGGRIAEKAIAGAIVPAGLALATYALTPEEESVEEYLKANPMDPNRAAYDQWSAIADKNSAEAIALKNQWYGQSQYSAAQLGTSFGANPISGITSLAAGGGEIVGPGTGTSDSIPARLSDGEFVMTAKAVRNAGNGDRDVGAARMYDMMNRFERGVA